MTDRRRTMAPQGQIESRRKTGCAEDCELLSSRASKLRRYGFVPKTVNKQE
jgi:hypothetical protein